MKACSRLVVAVLFFLPLIGCGGTVTSVVPDRQLLSEEESLWRLTLMDGAETRYAGLLILAWGPEGVRVVLLDSTGIKLLEGWVRAQGKMELISNISRVSESGLAEYLNSCLRTVFFDEKAPTPCVRKGLVRICRQEEAAGQIEKAAGIGPFSLWKVTYFNNKDLTASPVRVEMHKFAAPDLILEKIEQ